MEDMRAIAVHHDSGLLIALRVAVPADVIAYVEYHATNIGAIGKISGENRSRQTCAHDSDLFRSPMNADTPWSRIGFSAKLIRECTIACQIMFFMRSGIGTSRTSLAGSSMLLRNHVRSFSAS